MEVIIIEKESWNRLMADLSLMVKSAAKDAAMEAIEVIDPANDWITLEQAQKILGVKSRQKVVHLRDVGEIAFTQHGKIYRYSKKSIQEFLLRNKVSEEPARLNRRIR